MEIAHNPINWFEISCSDLERAKKFYSTVLGVQLQDFQMGDTKMALFPMDTEKPGAGGSLLLQDDAKPSPDGTTIYFRCDDVNVEAGRVEAAGGKIYFPKMDIGEHGFVAQFYDTEGNRIGLHSSK